MMRRRLWHGLGLIALALGIVGVALPVVPTVPFLLLAAAAFARSSPRLERRILEHPTYGPPVRAWRERGAISRIAKIWSTVAMACGVGFSLLAGMPIWIVAAQAMICSVIAAYLVTRPET